MSPTWSWVIGGLSVTASILLARKNSAGWGVALLANLAMGGYGAATGQNGFVAAEAAFVASNVYGWSQWREARGNPRAVRRRPLSELLEPYRPAPFARHNARR